MPVSGHWEWSLENYLDVGVVERYSIALRSWHVNTFVLK